MARFRRRRRRRRPDEEQSVPLAQKRRDARAQMAQRRFGNRYVQAAARSNDEAERKQHKAKQDKGLTFEPVYRFNAPAALYGDRLKLNLTRGIDLGNYNINPHTLPGPVKQWSTSGAFFFGEQTSQQFTHTVQTDGLLPIKLNPALYNDMLSRTKQHPDAPSRLNPENPFGTSGLMARGTLLFNSAELNRHSIVVDHNPARKSEKGVPGVYLIIDLTGKFPAPGVGEKPQPFIGQLVMTAGF